MKVVAVVPAKGSSTRIENKNTKLLDGKPLFLHTIEKLLSCDFINEVYLDTDSDEIISLASEHNCKIMRRDPNLATNETDGNKLFINEVLNIKADIYIQALCTSPFIDITTIKKGVDALQDKELGYDSVVLVKKQKQYIWRAGKPEYSTDRIPNSVELEDTIIETMGLYIMRYDDAIKLKKRIGLYPLLLEARPHEAIDVNWPDDFYLANLIAAGLRENDRKLLSNIRYHLSSSILSDILDDLSYPNQVIKNLSPNLKTAKILGRAKTLKLRFLTDGEDFKGIYNALESYNTIVPNDIIVVENEASEHAYFGELNANLAIRSGASGVIIGGKTRDSAEVYKMGLPVFSAGYSCQDVRKRATLDSYNKTIKLHNVSISPSDLIFGDNDGIVVIPKHIEQKVLDEVFSRTKCERRMLIDISLGKGIEHLVSNHGFF